MEAEELCNVLINARENLGLTMAAVTRAITANRNKVGALNKWENGDGWPRLDLFVEWAEALGYEVILKSQRGPKKG